MANQTLNNLTDISASLQTFIAAANADGLLGKLRVDILKNIIGVAANFSLDSATPTTDPGDPTGNRMWLASQAGTYTNFTPGSIVIAADELAFIVDNGTNFSKVEAPIDPVDLAKVVVSTPGKNMIDPATVIQGNVNSSGAIDAILPTTGWLRTGYINVSASTAYTFSAVNFTPTTAKVVAFYDASNAFISFAAASVHPYTFTTPVGAAKLIMNIKQPTDGSTPSNLQLEQGSVATTYEPWQAPVEAVEEVNTFPLLASYIKNTTGNNDFVAAVMENNVTTEDVITKNLLDESLITVGYVNSSGVILTTAGWLRTGQIPVMQNSTYTFSGVNFTPSSAKLLTYFNASNAAITRTSIVAALPFTFTTPAGTAYIIINIKEPTDTLTPSMLQVENENVATPYEPHKKTYVTQILGFDILPADSVAPSAVGTPFVNLYPQIYAKLPRFREAMTGKITGTIEDRVTILMQGDSLFARDVHTTVGPVVPSEYPPTLTTNNIGAHIFRGLHTIENPVYARFDKSGVFTETGTWANTTTGWDDAGARSNITRTTVTSAATLAFTIENTYNAFNFLDRTALNGSTAITIAVTGGAGKIQIKQAGVWVEANGAVISQLETAGANRTNSVYARRIEFKKIGATVGVAATLTLTKAADATTFLYWGLEKMKGTKPYVELTNISRGGATLANLANYTINDITERKPKLVILEIPLLNMVAANSTPTYSVNWVQDYLYGDRVGATNTWNLKTQSNNWVDFEVLVVLPHFSQRYFNSDGTMITETSGYNGFEIWNAIKSFLYSKGDIGFIDISAAFRHEVDLNYGGNYYAAFAGSGANGNTLSSDAVHQNDRGTQVWARHLVPVFDMNTF